MQLSAWVFVCYKLSTLLYHSYWNGVLTIQFEQQQQQKRRVSWCIGAGSLKSNAQSSWLNTIRKVDKANKREMEREQKSGFIGQCAHEYESFLC